MNQYPASNRFLKEFYPRLSPEGKQKADRLLDEYSLRYRYLTKEESAEAGHMLAQIITAHTVKPMPKGSWAPSWRAVLTMMVVNTLLLAIIFRIDWISAFIRAWGAEAVTGILAALLIAFYKAKDTE